MYHQSLLTIPQCGRLQIFKNMLRKQQNCSAGLKKKSQYRMSWLVNLGVVVEEHRRIVVTTQKVVSQILLNKVTKF
jgi:hypothetical protein